MLESTFRTSKRRHSEDAPMKRLVTTVVSVAFCAAASAGVHPPEVEQRLAFLVNDWTIEGAEETYRENCEWYADRSFVVCNSDDRESGESVRSVSVLGWSAATQNYTYHHYAQNGRSRSETCFANEQGGLTCLGARRDGARLIETRSHIWPEAGGAAFRSERSENGGPWKETIKLRYVPRK
jgi:hypothetical protein